MSTNTAGVRSLVIVSEHETTQRAAATTARRRAGTSRAVVQVVWPDCDLELLRQGPQLFHRVDDIYMKRTAGDVFAGPQHVHVVDADLRRIISALDAAIVAR